MSRSLESLDRSGRDAARAFVAAARSAGYPVVVISARRTAREQARLTPGAGLPVAKYSRHVLGRAFDLGFSGYRYDEVNPEVWELLGRSWESLGGRWGGRFRDFDPVHFDW